MIVDRKKMNHYSMIAWFFDMMAAQYAEKFPEDFQKACDKNNDDGIGIDLRLTMDGNELDLEPFFLRLEEHFAEELVKGVKLKIDDVIEESFDPIMKEFIRLLKKKRGIKDDNQTVS